MSWVGVAAVYGALAVAAGAFGAHGLRGRLAPEMLGAWNTAAQYHLLHSVVLLALGLLELASERSVRLPASLIAVGVLLFSGSIYGLALGGPRLLGPVTPIGGALLIAGWVSLLTLARAPASG